LHLGHYAEALENWLRLQATYDCHFLIADYQVADYAGDVARVRDAVWEVALDWLAVGLDPERGAFVIESLIPEHAELMVWLSWLLPMGMLQRNPTLKAELEAHGRQSVPVAFFTYPIRSPISCCRAPISSPWARTSSRTSGSRAASIASSRRCFPSRKR